MQAIIWTGQQINTLSEVAAVELPATGLRPGMVLVDPELRTPAAAVDHRMRTIRGSGEVRYLVTNLDAPGWSEINLSARGTVLVMATAL